VHADLRETAAYVEAGVLKPVIDTRYPLERVADAHAHVERGKVGHIVLTMG
jgi:NADPH:quinone reductase-like Zn-dependent oxidoreductase